MQQEIGERIRKMRAAQGLEQEEVSRLAGLTAERLDAFEQGREVPSIGVAIKLSRVLGSRMGGLLHGGGVSSELLTIVRAGESAGGSVRQPEDTDQGYTYQTLTRQGTPGHDMEPFLLTFHPGNGDINPIAHEGQEFVYVLEGRIELFYDGLTHTLEQGDNAYLDSGRLHLFRALGESPARVLAVVSAGR